MLEPGGPMKKKGSNKCSELEEPVWCDHCRVRIAPYEETLTAGAKSFHKHCFSKAERDPSGRGPLPLLAEEGWLRHQNNIAKRPKRRRRGGQTGATFRRTSIEASPY